MYKQNKTMIFTIISKKTHLDKETFYGSVKFFCITKTIIFTIFQKNFKRNFLTYVPCSVCTSLGRANQVTSIC